MASLQLTVFSNATSTAVGDVLQEEIIAVSGTSAQSNAITGSGNYRVVRMYADVDCFITWGSNPTALSNGTGGRFVGANNPEYFRLQAGEKVAVIERT